MSKPKVTPPRTKESGQVGIGRVITWALGYWRPHRRAGSLIFLLLVVQQLFRIYYALSLKLIIDNVLAGTNDPPLSLIIVTLLAGFVIATAATIASDFQENWAGARIVNDIRREMFGHLQRLSLDFYKRAQLGDLLARFSSDLDTLKLGATKRLVEGVLSTIGLTKLRRPWTPAQRPQSAKPSPGWVAAAPSSRSPIAWPR